MAGRRAEQCARVESVSFVNVPSFVLHGGLPVKLGARTIRVDVAFGGAFYAIVDGEAVGLPIDAEQLPELRRVGMEIKHAVEAAQTVVASARARADGHLRHDLHRPAERRARRPAQRDDLRRRGSRSVAVRHRHGGGDGRARRDGPARRATAVRAREPHRHAVQRARRVADDGGRASRRSCRRSKARPGSPASTRSWSTRTIR